MWDRAKVKEVAEGWAQRRTELGPAAGAALAYARWQGLTDEPDVDRDLAKRELDQQMDAVGGDGPTPDHIRQLMGHVADDVLVGLMKYSLRRSMDGLKQDGVQLEQTLALINKAAPPKEKRRDREK